MEKDAFKFSGEAALNYDKYLGPLLFEPYAINLVSQINAANVTSALEIACGTGRVTKHLRAHLPSQVKLVASDINPDMLQVAKDKLNDDTIEFRMEDAQSLSFPDNSFDLVVFQFGLMFLPDKKKGFSEAFRVLKPGGRFIFNTWDKTNHVPLLNLIFNDTILPYFKGEDTNRFLVPFSLSDPSVLEAWMKEAGFSNIKTGRIVLKSQAPSAKDIVNGFFIKHALGMAVSAKDPAAFEPMAQNMEKKITARFGAGNITVELAAFLASGEK